MIDKKYFFKGFKSIKGVGSPAIALGASFIAIGALLKNIGFNILQNYYLYMDHTQRYSYQKH